ncbi:hypothetical protein BRD09_01325 [Halobacteriales archaeon SW_10_68_16]|jgi:hypothetical protein|nr:MAG: hypothetical protein BRD09_01325 [Halobacteriales archaeon SW_10_68_16]
MVFLAGRDRYTQRTLLRDVHDRLVNQPGCETVRYRPSRRRPRFVVTDVETAAFLGSAYDVERARLEVRFWYPAESDHAYYRINWLEPARDFAVGFHRDGSHSDLGPCHVQVDFDGTTVDRRRAAFLDAHPLAVLDMRLQQLPSVLDSVRWDDGRPSLGAWSPVRSMRSDRHAGQ